MYIDLRQYTSVRNTELEEETYGWYIKMICERCRNKKLVKEFMEGLENAYDEGYTNEDINLMHDLFNDFHIQDALGTDEAVLLRMIIGCYMDDFIYHYDNRPLYVQFFDYSNQGRRLSGMSRNVLSEYLEDWTEFSQLKCFGTDKIPDDAEILQYASDGTLEENYGDMLMYSAIVVCDINDYELDDLFAMLSFVKVEEGLYYFGAISYECDESLWSGIDCRTLERIAWHIFDKPVVSELDDEIFIRMNEEILSNMASRLVKNIQFCNSAQEVLF